MRLCFARPVSTHSQPQEGSSKGRFVENTRNSPTALPGCLVLSLKLHFPAFSPCLPPYWPGASPVHVRPTVEVALSGQGIHWSFFDTLLPHYNCNIPPYTHGTSTPLIVLPVCFVVFCSCSSFFSADVRGLFALTGGDAQRRRLRAVGRHAFSGLCVPHKASYTAFAYSLAGHPRWQGGCFGGQEHDNFELFKTACAVPPVAGHI